MRKKQGFNLRRMCGENVIVAEGIDNIDFCNIISLNESAAEMWEALGDEEFTVEKMAEIFVSLYEGLDYDEAKADSEELAEGWIKAGMLES